VPGGAEGANTSELSSREVTVSDRVSRALADLEGGFNCAVSVLSAFAADFDWPVHHARQVAGAFGGGMGRTGATCGAVTGALMAIGLAYAKTRAEDDAARDRCYAEAAAFLQAFEQRCGSLACRTLLGHDVSTPEGYAAAQNSGAFRTVCPGYLRAAVELVEERLTGYFPPNR
jgi:C_GCAxxG_C_C family probable redox protein